MGGLGKGCRTGGVGCLINREEWGGCGPGLTSDALIIDRKAATASCKGGGAHMRNGDTGYRPWMETWVFFRNSFIDEHFVPLCSCMWVLDNYHVVNDTASRLRCT